MTSKEDRRNDRKARPQERQQGETAGTTEKYDNKPRQQERQQVLAAGTTKQIEKLEATTARQDITSFLASGNDSQERQRARQRRSGQKNGLSITNNLKPESF